MRCRLVGRDFKVKGVEEGEDLFAVMPPLESKKLMFRMVAAVRRQRRRRVLEEVKLMFIDVKKRMPTCARRSKKKNGWSCLKSSGSTGSTRGCPGFDG